MTDETRNVTYMACWFPAWHNTSVHKWWSVTAACSMDVPHFHFVASQCLDGFISTLLFQDNYSAEPARYRDNHEAGILDSYLAGSTAAPGFISYKFIKRKDEAMPGVCRVTLHTSLSFLALTAFHQVMNWLTERMNEQTNCRLPHEGQPLSESSTSKTWLHGSRSFSLSLS